MPTQRCLFQQNDIARFIKDIGGQIIAQNKHLDNVALLGILTAGVPIAERIQKGIKKQTGQEIPVGSLDIALYRDDLYTTRAFPEIRYTEVPFSVSGKHIILVDDVLFTGRTIRAAIDAILDLGRPQKIDIAVLIDRGHRELPFRAQYIGKTMTTKKTDHIKVVFEENKKTAEVLQYSR